MVILKMILSQDAPAAKNVVWAKPISGGFALYLFDAGKWQPLRVVDDNGTPILSDDTTINVKNKADKVSSATYGNLASLNSNGNLEDSGKKASDFDAAGAAAAVVGTAEDSKDTMTLYGLKAYIDDALAG